MSRELRRSGTRRRRTSMIRRVVEAMEPRTLLTTLTVNATADTDVRDSVLTFREAIRYVDGQLTIADLSLAEQALVTDTGTPGLTIGFDLPGTGPQTIATTSALPAITAPVTIDGTLDPDFSGTPVVRLLGTSAGASVDGLVLQDASTVQGLAILGFDGAGIRITASGGGSRIQGNNIGIDTDGTTLLGNAGGGIIADNSPNNIIGGTTTADRNLITGNGSVFGASSTTNLSVSPLQVISHSHYDFTSQKTVNDLFVLDQSGGISFLKDNGDGTHAAPTL